MSGRPVGVPPEAVPVAARLRAAIDVLELLASDRRVLDALPSEERARFLRALSKARGPASRTRRRLAKAAAREERLARVAKDRRLRAETGIQSLRRRPTFTTPNVFPPSPTEADASRAIDPQACYVCKCRYETIHHFYDQLCPRCAELNFAKRTELADLQGRVALVTGGRVKIGYQAALRLLRSGARVIVTTRFPRDAAARYALEADSAEWRDRLEIVGLDLRHTPSVEALCQHLHASYDRLDFIVNNACQTVRRPPAFYAHMMAGEVALRERDPGLAIAVSHHELQGAGAAPLAPLLSQVPLLPEEFGAQPGLFPAGQLDTDLQQVDLRGRNSWRLLLAEVSTVELLEVHLVNAIAPFVINARLKPLMQRTPGHEKHIVNVSAVEGQFYRSFKTTRHPHTNMAKAALNMMTRTAAADYHADGIHMNSVDTGWVTDEDPVAIARRKTEEQGFHPPLDAIDGAARIVDPIITGITTGIHTWGQFLKDYQPTDW